MSVQYFEETTHIYFNSISSAPLEIVSVRQEQVQVRSPPYFRGPLAVDVLVTNTHGTTTVKGGFTYTGSPPSVTGLTPSSGSTLGGDEVSILGSNFYGITTVALGGSSIPFTLRGSNTIRISTPSHAAGTVDLSLDGPFGPKTFHSVFEYRYFSPPNIVSLTPKSTIIFSPVTPIIIIHGTGLATTSKVQIGPFTPSFKILGDTAIEVETPNRHPPGAVNVTVTTAYGVSTLGNAFTFVNGLKITSISPSFAPTGYIDPNDQKFRRAWELHGENLYEIQGLRLTPTGSGHITYNIESSKLIKFTPPTHKAGSVVISVFNEYGQAAASFMYYDPITINGISPSWGPPAGGTNVTISGHNFFEVEVRIANSEIPPFTVDGSSNILVTMPAHPAAVVTIEVKNRWYTATTSFGYLGHVELQSISPHFTGINGGKATIRGANFGGVNKVLLDGSSAKFEVVSFYTIDIVAPPHTAGSVDVVVVTDSLGTATLRKAFTYFAQVPTILSSTPNRGTSGGGTEVYIKGYALGNTIGVNLDYPYGVACDFKVNSDTLVTVTMPREPVGARNRKSFFLRIGSPYSTEISIPNAFQYDNFQPSRANKISPNHGPANDFQLVTICGSDLERLQELTLGDISLSFYKHDYSTITAIMPPHELGTVSLGLFDGADRTIFQNAFTYTLPVPIISNISPSSGPVRGDIEVSITGLYFERVEDVRFGKSAASFQISTPGVLRVLLPPSPIGVGVVDVTLITPDGPTDFQNAFTYTA